MVRTALELLVDARAELAEGPIWDAPRRQLLWIDQIAGTVYRAGLDGTSTPLLVWPGRVGCVAATVDGGLVLGTDSGFVRVDPAGATSALAPLRTGVPPWFVNDGKCDAMGNLWAGSIALSADGTPVRAQSSVHRLDARSEAVRTVIRHLTAANGLDWSPDRRTFYLVDSQRRDVLAFDADLETGLLGRRRRVVDLGSDGPRGFPDGMCVDADGCLWIAVWGVGEVRRYTVRGAVDRIIRLPVSQPSSCTFAGDRLDTLVITTAWYGLTPDARERQQHAGALFCCFPGVTGMAANMYGVRAAG